jgi:hypothetical protein
MKLAICLSGMPRHFEECFESIKENIIDLYDTDIFIDVWDDKILDDINHTNPQSGVRPIKNHKNINLIYDLYKPKIYKIENYDENRRETFINLIPQFNKIDIRSSRFYSSYYKIFSCKDLKASYEKIHNFKYDICMRIRLDCFILNKFIIPNTIKDNEVFMPFFANQGGVNDQIWYANSETYDKICDLYYNIHHLSQYLNNSPENILNIYLRLMNINVELVGENYNNFIIYKYIDFIFHEKFSGKEHILEKYKTLLKQ